MRQCKACKGSGEGLSGPCLTCSGKGMVEAPDGLAILKQVLGRKGLRSKRPSDPRAYYVWRLARFHGGADVTMPALASMLIWGDPYRAELDELAEAVARAVFGTDLAAAHRWGQALGWFDRELPGLPATAYRGGPVLQRPDKPEEERAELE